MKQPFFIFAKIVVIAVFVAGFYVLATSLRLELPDNLPATVQQAALSSIITTPVGDLTLSYQNGEARLEGVLQRATPCVEWVVFPELVTDDPPTFIEFVIFDSNRGQICAQVVGEPQLINATTTSSAGMIYRVLLEESFVFIGDLEGNFSLPVTPQEL